MTQLTFKDHLSNRLKNSKITSGGPTTGRSHSLMTPEDNVSLSRKLRGRKGLAFTIAAAGAAVVAMVVQGSAIAGVEPAVPSKGDGVYIVQLDDAPAAAYNGGVAGLRATKPGRGEKLDRSDPAVRSYVKHLSQERADVLDQVSGVNRLYNYNYTVAGFSARLTRAQVAQLRGTEGVLSVTHSGVRKLDTSTTPAMLGLTGDSGVWQRQFGGTEHAGEGVIVGIIDSGIHPEHPSFAPLPASSTDDEVKARFRGTCDKGQEEPYFTCNNKLIGGRYFVDAIAGSDTPPVDAEYLSPRGYASHGTHTASTAAGNYGVDAVVDGVSHGAISGMAPAARVADYKVCWTISDAGDDSCYEADIVAAVEAAVADGVDVLNYSISGSLDSSISPEELAFMNAATAGVFVAASAGNSGPDASTVAHNVPWLTTVAAGTHDRSSTASVTLGNGKAYEGAGSGTAVPSAPLVASTAVGKAGADPEQVRLCAPDTLDPAKVKDTIVACDRGVIARVDKSRAVKQAGGVGMILINTSPNSLNADFQLVPTVHLDDVQGKEVKAYLAAGGSPTAEIAASTTTTGAPGAKVASFSSRGPALAGSGDLLKPDIMAPGVDVLAGTVPNDLEYGRSFDLMSGTSMSSPHIAGIAALVIAAHPDWTPMQVKSALMTTATTLDNKGEPITTDSGGAAGPLDYGSGWVVPSGAFSPGLVYDSSVTDWRRYLCGTGEFKGRQCRISGKIDPSDLNTPSIAIGALVDTQTVTRTVTSVASTAQTYSVSVAAPDGVAVKVSPATFTVEPGKSVTLKITITRTTAPLGGYAFGALTLQSDSYAVRSPIAVKPSRH